MWNPFRKKANGQAEPSNKDSQQINRVDELANTLDKEGRAKELEHELMMLDLHSLSEREQESWWHLYGIVAFQEGRDAEALERFKAGYEKFPSSAHIRFSLGQQYLRARLIDEGFALLRTCKFPEIPREYALAQARYAYLWNRYDDGFLFLRPFFDGYKQLKILDDHFLYVRGLPFFGRWWAHWAAFSILTGDVKELEEITEFVAKNCYDYDFQYLKTELAAHRDDRPELLLTPLEKSVGARSTGFPTGYLRMSIAVIKARMASTPEAAHEALRGVTLPEQDFPWLEDVRTLARAEVASRFGDSVLESQCVEAFLDRQPMLFEPDIALNFFLLRYQERLKPRVKLR